MKVRVALTIEVDPKVWANSNGYLTDADGKYTAAEVRDDIRNYVFHLVQGSPMVDETEAEVTR